MLRFRRFESNPKFMFFTFTHRAESETVRARLARKMRVHRLAAGAQNVEQ